ncbi:MAG: signal peptidase II [Myxococcota bacterium]
MSMKFRVALFAFAFSFLLDVGTKIAIDANLSYADRIPVIDGFFYLTHVRNTGAAFGLFASAPPLPRLAFFIGVSIVAVGIIISFYRKLSPGDRLASLALGLILGGALGNLVDRIFRQEVVDFLHFRLWRGYSWPDFNVADSAIVIGVGLLVLDLLATEGEKRASKELDESNA